MVLTFMTIQNHLYNFYAPVIPVGLICGDIIFKYGLSESEVNYRIRFGILYVEFSELIWFH